MNRLLYVLLISAITIAGFTMYKQNDIGEITFRFADIAFQTNLIVFSAAVACIVFVISGILRLWQFLGQVFAYFGSKRSLRLREKAHQALNQGLIEYAEGRFQQSEKLLLQYIKYSDNRLLAYLSAARAAQQIGAHDRRDEYLRKAHIEAPDADVAIGLTKAELQLAHDQNEQALATLSQLHKLAPDHTYVIALLANTYRQLQDWDNLHEILPQLKKHGNLSDDRFLTFEVDVCNGQLNRLTDHSITHGLGSQPLLDYWQKTPSHLNVLPEIVEHYARQLIRVDAAGEAEQVLRNYLNKNWHESTIVLYSELDIMVDNKQLDMVEGWLEQHQQNAYLLLALGKMCISRSLWGKARNYLEASIAIDPMPENYLKLARLLEENMNETAAAQEYYRQGLHLLAGDYGDEILDRNLRDFERETPQLKIVKKS